MDRRSLLKLAAGGMLASRGFAEQRAPNIVLIYADDLGYGDLGCYGSRLRTPNLDALAAGGVRLTDFCSASSVCSPARAGLLTGRYPVRVGVPGVLGQDDPGGLTIGQPTLADLLKTAGYRTACVGKWHLGNRAEYLPTARGFDSFFGIPYSHDMWPRPLMRGCEVIEEPAKLGTLTHRFTEEATAFIRREQREPFFLYLAQTDPHIPLAPSPRFRRRSHRGPYADVLMELDWSVGEVMRAVRESGQADNTLVLFSSDNGPWHQGSRGPFRGRKGEAFEGGFRVPLLAHWPGRLPTGRTVHELTSALDIVPTLAKLAGVSVPYQPDGLDIWPLLAGETDTLARDALLYFHFWNIQAVRRGKWKVHFTRYNAEPSGPAPAGGRKNLPLPHPELYDLDTDFEESSDVSDDEPEIVEEVRARVEELVSGMPAEVVGSWYGTMQIPVENTPSGALPIERQS